MGPIDSILEIDLSSRVIEAGDLPLLEKAECIVAENCFMVSEILHARLIETIEQGTNVTMVKVKTSVYADNGYPVGGRFHRVKGHYEIRSFGAWVLSPPEASKASNFWLNRAMMRDTAKCVSSWWPEPVRSDLSLLCDLYWTSWTHFLNIDQLI